MSSEYPQMQGAVCPLPIQQDEVIVMGHGSGGRLMHDLIKRHFLPHLSSSILLEGNDAGVVDFTLGPTQELKLAISTDAHVVSPIFFPGGDIGRLAVCGTVNDVAAMGAKPLYLTISFVLEEGFRVQDLEKILGSIHTAADEAGVQVIAGDTKVVQKGQADGIFITTSGIGVVYPGVAVGGAMAKPADVVLVSGTLGDHGIAVLEARGELGFESGIKSDTAPLNRMIQDLIMSGCRLHVLRDPTRGGLASTLNEIAQQSQVGVKIDEKTIPINRAVIGACEFLGLDPLYIANEGKFIVIVDSRDEEKALEVMRNSPYGESAVRIGEVIADPPGRVLLKTVIGTTRIIDMPSGELLPRIC